MQIPLEFEKKYQKLMALSEYNEFIESFTKPKISGLRVNRLKIDMSKWLEISPFHVSPVAWSRDGFYLEDDKRPGIHPFYHAGLYYIQEPSAMLPAELLDARPGDKVLDLCAAPGGKTVRLAADMENRGLLVSNDISPKRIKALEKNIELYGITNSVITNESPENLARVYGCFFDKILLDVPCSGEGMLRRDSEAIKSWERYKSFEWQGLQRRIFDYAYQMLVPGGSLVYSTCTFNPEENEQNIASFLKNYPDMCLKEILKNFGIEPGRPDWADGNPELLKTARLWPHRVNGEGHFAAHFVRNGEDCKISCESGNNENDDFKNYESKNYESKNCELKNSELKNYESKNCELKNSELKNYESKNREFKNRELKNYESKNYESKNYESKNCESENFESKNALKSATEKNMPKSFYDFCDEMISTPIVGNLIQRGGEIHLLPQGYERKHGLRTIKTGVYLGSESHLKFEPSHSFIMAMKWDSIKKGKSFERQDPLLQKYLKGETLPIDGEKGYIGLGVENYPLGWGKLEENGLKNLYPKGWRKSR